MKLPHLLLFLGASGLAVSVYALQAHRSQNTTDSQTTYYTNGQVQSQTSLVDGHKQGISRRFYSDGKKMAEGEYVGGKMEGEWTFWRPDGGIDTDKSGTYHDGAKQPAKVAQQQAGE